MTDDKPEELIKISFIRACVLEHLATIAGMRKQKEELFLLGLFSLIDALSDTPMEEVVEKINLPATVSSALLSGSGKLTDMLNLVVYYERGDWVMANEIAKNTTCQ